MRGQQVKATFHGDHVTTYAEYIDAAKGSTLVAEPGGTYDITPARGHARDLPMPPDGRWKPARTPAKTKKELD
jgi:hypothetical protein